MHLILIEFCFLGNSGGTDLRGNLAELNSGEEFLSSEREDVEEVLGYVPCKRAFANLQKAFN